jgi:hypothetical protein
VTPELTLRGIFGDPQEKSILPHFEQEDAVLDGPRSPWQPRQAAPGPAGKAQAGVKLTTSPASPQSDVAARHALLGPAALRNRRVESVANRSIMGPLRITLFTP